jgi:GTPase SAR1 family protein
MNSSNQHTVNHADSSGDLTPVLDPLIQLAASPEAKLTTHAIKLAEIRERLSQGRIHLAVLGQFKRGKSSLLNALLEEEVLPSSVIPLTSIPTYVRYGRTRRACVHFTDQARDKSFVSDSTEELCGFLSRHVSEEENPGNRMEVTGVELYHDSPFLQKGAVLIDTPGIGSTHLHNTEATLNFMPQCDAALFLVSADPPITEVEIEFLGQVRRKIERIFFIINKIDYLTSGQQAQVVAFITRVLKERAGFGADLEMYPLSARLALEGARTNDPSLIQNSGIEDLKKRLDSFMSDEKQAVLKAALSRKTADIVDAMELQVRLTLKAYTIPAEELENKLSNFDNKIKEAAHQKLLSSDILTGERKRLLHFLEEQAESVRKKSRSHLETILNEYFSRGGTVRENDVRGAFARAIPVFFEHELGAMSALFDERVAEIIGQHLRRADEIIDYVRKSASDIFDIPYRDHAPSEGLELASEPYWVIHKWKSSLVPLPDELIDRLIPRKLRERRIRKRLEEQIGSLVMNNVENLRWSTVQNLDTTFRKFMKSLEERFSSIIAITREAVTAALEKRKNYAEKTAAKISRLEGVIACIENIKTNIGSGTRPDRPGN